MQINELMKRIEEERKLAFYAKDINMLDFMSDIYNAMTKLVAVSVAMNALRNKRHDEEAQDVLSEAFWQAEFLIEPENSEE